MGLIGQTRSYGLGLDLLNSKVNFLVAFHGIFSEAKIFFTTGKVIELVPNELPYAGFKPIINAITSPIPSFFVENKNSADYVEKAFEAVYGSKQRSIGAAYMNFAEYYYMGGWLSVISCSALIGSLYKFCWKWFYSRRDELLAHVIYGTNLVFAYVLISRGFISQMIMLYFFTIFPIIFFYYKFSKRINQ